MYDLLLLDGNALLHRAWHAIPPLSAPDGTVVNALYGFANTIEKLLVDYENSPIVVAWDLPGGTFRHKAFDEYKAQRKKKEPELYAQIPLIQELLEAYGIESISMEGYEADDVIGSLATQHAANGDEVLIITGDLDALQLVSENVHVLTFVKGLSKIKIYDIEAVKERYELRPDQIVDLKAFMGDSSDNIPGIAGIGAKSATSLLQNYEHGEGVFDALEKGEVVTKFAKKLEGQKDRFFEMRHLTQIVNDLDVQNVFEAPKLDRPGLHSLYEKYAIRTLAAKYMNDGEDHAAQKQKVSSIPQHVAIASPELPLPELSRECIGERLKETFISQAHFPKNAFDITLAEYIIDSNTRDYSVDALAVTYGAIGSLEEQIYAISERQKSKLAEANLGEIAQMEMGLLPVLHSMERDGILVDREHLSAMSEKGHKEIDRLTAEIYELAGREFNINSPAQLSEILFEELELPTKGIKKTKTAYSTAASELEKLWEEHEIIPKISEYREITKLVSTYIDALPHLIAPDERIHTTFNQTVTATGRLSSSDPNLQNIPVRTELGREVRGAFVAAEGHVLVAADYSQVELRLAAELSGDDGMRAAFARGADIHTSTAARIFGKDESEITKRERSSAKAINFGILYGMGSRALARQTGLTSTEAKTFIEKYFEAFPGIRDYMDVMKAKAHADGYVETMYGRRRYLPQINSGMQMLRAMSERMAINMPVQGTSADLIKLAMIDISAWLEESNSPARMLLQVHDELIFEVPKADAESFAAEVKRRMEAVWHGEVPIVADASTGPNWNALERI